MNFVHSLVSAGGSSPRSPCRHWLGERRLKNRTLPISTGIRWQTAASTQRSALTLVPATPHRPAPVPPVPNPAAQFGEPDSLRHHGASVIGARSARAGHWDPRPPPFRQWVFTPPQAAGAVGRSANNQLRWAPNTAVGYAGRPRLPL